MGQLLDFYGVWLRGAIRLCPVTPHIGLHGRDSGACSSPGKVPIDFGWPKLPDRRRGVPLETIERDLEEHLARAGNVGLCVPPGVLVLDADTEPALARLATVLTDAPLQRSGHGGHLVVCSNLDVTNRVKVALESGLVVDLRGHRSQIVTYPSIHANGRDYYWERSLPQDARDLPELPVRWAEPIRRAASREIKNLVTIDSDISESIPAGKRNETLFALARSLRARGLPVVVVAEAVKAVNFKHCIPPLDDSELGRLLRSARELRDSPDYRPSA